MHLINATRNMVGVWHWHLVTNQIGLFHRFFPSLPLSSCFMITVMAVRI